MVEIRLKTGNSIKNLSILNSYVPNIGYPTETIDKYWVYVEAYISLIPNNMVKIWRADNNGQLRRNGTNSNYIGESALENKLGNVSSNNLSKSCGNNEWAESNTFVAPKKQ